MPMVAATFRSAGRRSDSKYPVSDIRTRPCSLHEGYLMFARNVRIAGAITVLLLVAGCSAAPAASTALAASDRPATSAPTASPQSTASLRPAASLQPSSAPISQSPGASADPDPFRVVEISLHAEPRAYAGACPVTITFPGTITVVGSGTVSWVWESSDGDSSPVQTDTFTRSGSHKVSSNWKVAQSVPTGQGWESIRILDPIMDRPDSAWKTQVSFTVACS